jgi:hypothetical protein
MFVTLPSLDTCIAGNTVRRNEKPLQFGGGGGVQHTSGDVVPKMHLDAPVIVASCNRIPGSGNPDETILGKRVLDEGITCTRYQCLDRETITTDTLIRPSLT